MQVLCCSACSAVLVNGMAGPVSARSFGEVVQVLFGSYEMSGSCRRNDNVQYRVGHVVVDIHSVGPLILLHMP